MEQYFNLKKEHIYFLTRIKNIRLNQFYLGAFFTSPPILFSVFLRCRGKYGRKVIVDYPKSQLIWEIFSFIFLFIILFCFFYFIYIKKIKPIQKDLSQKTGEIVYSQIIRKTEFHHTNQYFIFFDDVKMPNKEINQEEFYKFTLGDYYPVYRGKHSKIIFDDYGNFEVL